MLELAVLGLLSEQPRHGYELKKRLSETLGPLWGISFGSLYPALRRLERSGAIEEVDETADAGARRHVRPHRLAQGRPRRRPHAPAGRAPALRTRKAYRITDRGRAAVRRAPHRRERRRRARLRAEALVLPPPRPGRRASRSSSAGARSSPSGWPRPSASPRPAPSIATPGRSSSTGPSPPSTISSGSTS